MELSWKKLGLIPLAIVAFVALALAACGDDSDAQEDGDSSAQADAAMAAAQQASVTAAMLTYRVEALHDIDDAAQKASEIEAGWSGSVTRMRQVTAGTDWPDELSDMAGELETELTEAEAALDDEDLEAFKEHIGLAHAAWHDMEHDAYAWIAGEETGEHGDEEDDDHGAEASPGATHDDQAEASPEAGH